ncbi:hypothetical protein VZ95_11385 [Elstera litoralis]|uniref:DUF2946 domain-containing protein n=1 Tax=Elstera litoralis TaxID=552518 RepID=A0A0F3IS41_9PROT|nr:hypothetical protein [Elstera litoralis]KJV09447.1 hypothetical protein VZ95_11385 [Elstera litoralis]
MRLGLFRRFSALLLIAALFGNLVAPLAAAAADSRGLNVARAELAGLFGGANAFCTPGGADDDTGTPPGHADASCILCCLPQPLRFAVAAVPPVVPFPALAIVAAPWPVLSPVVRTPDAAPSPYRPRDPPLFG